MRFQLAFSGLVCLMIVAKVQAVEPFKIRIVDAAGGRGVPLVELTTVNNVRFVSDSAGLIALDDSSLMGQRVYFHIKSHGYEFPADGFGYRGRALDVTPAGEATLELTRLNIAERLYRVTGAGIYLDSMKLNEPVPIEHPLLNSGVTGSDSVVNAVFCGRLYWFWGDTNLKKYPLGILTYRGQPPGFLQMVV